MKISTGSLKDLGLTEYESKCLVTLLSTGRLTAREVAKYANIPTAPVYETLRSLERKGLVNKIQKEPLAYEAIKPKNSISELVKREKKRLDFIAEETIETLTNIKTERKEEPPEEYIKVYAGKQHRFSIGLPIYATAKKEILSVTKSEFLPTEHFKEIKKAIKRGIEYKLIVTQVNESNESIIEKYLDLGASVRLNTSLDGYHLLLFDRKTVLMIIFNPQNNEDLTVVVLKNPGLANSFSEYLDKVWASSKPIKS